ncbi:hypothetical protein HDV00_006195 [Rhizophlyctis rosea]|nr:hypothetical protein HDV00_006195 [Rhizophlyctis rosea]
MEKDGDQTSQSVQNITFNSHVVSWTHAELSADANGQVYIKDLGSSRGTFLNGVRLFPSDKGSKGSPLKSGDLLQLGIDYRGKQEDIFKCVRAKFSVLPIQESKPDPQCMPIIVPDVLILIFAQNSISIADLLWFEQVCKQRCTIIRLNPIQIWKPKLVQAYSRDCCPVLYGQENWRDVATLWLAWNRLWNWPSLEENVTTVDEVGVSETLVRRKEGQMRDVVDYQCSVSARECSNPQGGRTDGRTIVKGIIRPGAASTDVLIAATKADTGPTLHDVVPTMYKRTKIVLRRPHKSNDIVAEGVENAAVATRILKSSGIHSVCGDNALIKTGHGDVQLLSLNNATSVRTFPRNIVSYAMNETIVATIDSSRPNFVTLIRVSDNSEIASCAVGSAQAVFMTRFNVFVETSDQKLFVYDFQLNLLNPGSDGWCWSKISERYSIRGLKEGPIYSRSLSGGCFGDWMMFFYPFWCGDDRCNLVVFEPKRRVFRRFVRVGRKAPSPHAHGEAMKRWNAQNRASVVCSAVGYWFVTMEYPVDEEGRRTGAGGQTKVYWRWLE